MPEAFRARTRRMILHLVLVAALLLDPNASARFVIALADAIGRSAPIFPHDDDKRRTVALAVAVAYREGGMRDRGVLGDHGRSFCTFQIHESSGGTAALLEDVGACVERGLAMLRESVRVCPAYPVAWYAEGPRGCTSRRAQRISGDRMWLADRIATAFSDDGT